MIWDVFIVLTIIIAAIIGWNIGIVNSWRSPLAMVIGTIATQKLYIDAAASLVGHVRIDPPMAVVISYAIIWPLFYLISETVLRIILPFGSKERPMFTGRILGSLWGLVVASVIIVLPATASIAPINIPVAAQDKAHLIMPMDAGIDNSTLIPHLKVVAKYMYRDLGRYVTSSSSPSSAPDYKTESEEQNQP